MTTRKVAGAKPVSSVPVKTKADDRSVAVPESRQAELLVATHCVMAAPYQYIQNEKMRGQSAEGSVDLYIGLQPKNALESILAGLIVNVSNATHDCLSQAARAPVQELQHRDLNLRQRLKGAVVAARLIDAYERVRGNRPGNNVSVGKVNVEAGGQAIVGTVQASPREPEPSSPTGPHAVKTRATK